MSLTLFQKKLCNILQNGLPIIERPFAEIASVLGSDEATVLAETKKILEAGAIRRISATIDYRTLGRISVLVAGHVHAANLASAAEAVSKLESVSHNYQRDHFFNLWFTLQGNSQSQIDSILAELSIKTGAEFHPLPALQVFKLDVRFDAESDGKSLLPADILPAKNAEITQVSLNEKEKALIKKLQQNLEIVSEPFTVAGNSLEDIRSLCEQGVIRRIAAVGNYRKLGFNANAMFVCAVEEDRIIEAGRNLAASNNVSHCYQRPSFAGWPYNLFGMMHGASMEQLEKAAAEFVSRQKISQFALLKTVQEFKKKPVSI